MIDTNKQAQLEADLDELHRELVKQIKAKIASGTATAADLKLAWDILKDNGVYRVNLEQAGVAPSGPLKLTEEPPFPEEDVA